MILSSSLTLQKIFTLSTSIFTLSTCISEHLRHSAHMPRAALLFCSPAMDSFNSVSEMAILRQNRCAKQLFCASLNVNISINFAYRAKRLYYVTSTYLFQIYFSFSSAYLPPVGIWQERRECRVIPENTAKK